VWVFWFLGNKYSHGYTFGKEGLQPPGRHCMARKGYSHGEDITRQGRATARQGRAAVPVREDHGIRGLY